MRITEFHITPIALTDPPLLNAAGLHAPYALRTIIELVTSDGISGVSEIPGSARTDEALEQARDLVEGMDPFDLHRLAVFLRKRFGSDDENRGQRPWDQRRLVHVFSALEVACLDIQGKILGRPVADLLGGIVRERVPFAAYLFYKLEGAGGELGMGIDPEATGWAAARQRAAIDPAGVVAQARAMVAEYGFRSIKLKGGAFPPDREAAAILALREAFGPEVPLRLDPNGVWKPETALVTGKLLEGVLEYLEDPVRGQESMAALRRSLKTPLATNMCTTSFSDLPSSVRLGSEDIILSDHHFWGGLRASMQLAGFCEVFDRGLSMHSNSHAGISLAAMVHLGAAAPNAVFDLDSHYPWQSEEIVAGGRRRFVDGCLEVSREPGLGVEIDRDALNRLHANYRRCGLTERDDEVEMRKVEPDWTFQAVRW